MHTRKCPKCNKEITHKTEISKNNSEKNNRLCRSCSASEINKRPGMRDKFIKKYASPGCNVGKENPFYGKKHTKETIETLKKIDKSYTKTEAFREKMSTVVAKGKDCHLYRTNNHQMWTAKHGKEEADRLEGIRKKKLSIANSGEKNPMFGKPSPKGSGNGWSGWYKNWYFRSLRELSYVVLVLEPSNLEWISADEAGIRIQYLNYNGKTRTYVPDFLIEKSRVVEIKPKKLISTPLVLAKSQAAKYYCEQIGLTYEITDTPTLSRKQMYDLRNCKAVRFIERYEKLYQEKYARQDFDNHEGSASSR